MKPQSLRNVNLFLDAGDGLEVTKRTSEENPKTLFDIMAPQPVKDAYKEIEKKL